MRFYNNFFFVLETWWTKIKIEIFLKRQNDPIVQCITKPFDCRCKKKKINNKFTSHRNQHIKNNIFFLRSPTTDCVWEINFIVSPFLLSLHKPLHLNSQFCFTLLLHQDKTKEKKNLRISFLSCHWLCTWFDFFMHFIKAILNSVHQQAFWMIFNYCG